MTDTHDLAEPPICGPALFYERAIMMNQRIGWYCVWNDSQIKFSLCCYRHLPN